MELRKKTLVIFGCFIIITLVCFLTYSSFILEKSYENIEIKEIQGDAQQVNFAFENVFTNLNSTLNDWSAWDDTYNFAKGNNSNYIATNLQSNTFSTLDLDFIFIFNSSGSILYAEEYNRTNGNLEPVSSALLDEIVRDYPLYPSVSSQTNSSLTGILVINRQPIAVAIQPILKSDESGPPEGVMIMGRNLDGSHLAILSKITGATINFIDPVTVSSDPRLAIVKAQYSEGNPVVILPLNQNTIQGFIADDSINITPERYYIEISEPRIVYQSGLSTLYSFLVIALIIVVVLGILDLLVLDWWVLSRIDTIIKDVRKIRTDDKNAKITVIAGKDELSQLSVEINSMLEQISQRKSALEQVTKKLALLNYITFNDIKNAIYMTRGYLSLGIDAKDNDSIKQYLKESEESVKKIENSLNFAKQYQDLGVSPPQWQNVNQAFVLGISHLDLSSIRRTGDLDKLEIYADPLLEQVFFTLASNVLIHSKNATEIMIDYQQNGDEVRLFFRDNGIGIPDENKEKIFNRGYGHQRGLELFLIREILGITGITIRETGTYRKGSCFEITIPKGAYRFNIDK